MKNAIVSDHGLVIKIKVEYSPLYSSPLQNNECFNFTITIWNNNPYAVHILGRSWDTSERPGWSIKDPAFGKLQLEGRDKGIYGQQRHVEAGGSFEWCGYHTDDYGIGKMEGVFYFRNELTGEEFQIKTPSIEFYSTPICN